MPSLPHTIEVEHPSRESIRVSLARDPLAAPSFASTKATLVLGETRAWVSSATDSVFASNTDGTITARADLETCVADVVALNTEVSPYDMTSILTLVSSLLLVRAGRTAIHSGAVVEPVTQRAWLLTGDSHSGKSTTTANLVRGGWLYLSDDYVVLSPADGDGVDVEGWPDDFHIDEGWSRGESTGARSVLAESALPSGSRRSSSPLGGILFTRISADEPTQIFAIDPAAALEKLMRQSPWLIADAKAAPVVLGLLQSAAFCPAGELRLGFDTYREPNRLAGLISDFAVRPRREP